MVGDSQTAEDLLQETMIRVFQNIERYRERGAFRSWIYRIASNLALTELRRARFRAEWSPEAVRIVPDARGPGIEEDLERRETGSALRRAIARLPDEQRAVILLRARRGLEIREIAEALSVPEGTVKSRLHYAVRSLRTLLREWEAPRSIGRNERDAMR
jgi:RNA polymerase sigma-70 factor (ECF subfamily)